MTLLIHPGFHKTGTTWLQDELFADTRLFNALMTHADVDRLIVRPHDFLFDPEPARTWIAAQRVDDGRVDVVSSEILSGSPFYGLREARALADRLKAIAPDARILLTVRAQPAILRSLYQQYIKRGGTLKPAAFFDQRTEPGYHGFDMDLLQFHLFADHYAALFGEQNVIVLPQELLQRQPQQFLETLMAFATGGNLPSGLTMSDRRGSGVSPPMGGTPLFRLSNRFRSTPLNPGGFAGLEWVGALLFKLGYRKTIGSEYYRREVETALSRLIRDRYAQSNLLLQRFVPLDLATLGYDVQSDGASEGITRNIRQTAN